MKPNQAELTALTGVADDPARAAGELVRRGIGAVLASLGEAGCAYVTQETEVYCPCRA